MKEEGELSCQAVTRILYREGPLDYNSIRYTNDILSTEVNICYSKTGQTVDLPAIAKSALKFLRQPRE